MAYIILIRGNSKEKEIHVNNIAIAFEIMCMIRAITDDFVSVDLLDGATGEVFASNGPDFD